MKRKQWLAALLALMVCAAPFGQFASAMGARGSVTLGSADGFYTDGDFTYKLVKNVATLWSYDGYDTEVTVPSEVFGYPVKKISNSAFAERGFLEVVTISEGIELIGQATFQRCYALHTVNIPHSVRTIGRNAFSFCTSLANISIPSGVVEMGDYVFSGCTKLTNVSLPNTLVELGCGAFSHCASLVYIQLPGSLHAIYVDTFRLCDSLRTVGIPAGVYYIDDNALSNTPKQYAFLTPDHSAAYYFAIKHGIPTREP